MWFLLSSKLYCWCKPWSYNILNFKYSNNCLVGNSHFLTSSSKASISGPVMSLAATTHLMLFYMFCQIAVTFSDPIQGAGPVIESRFHQNLPPSPKHNITLTARLTSLFLQSALWCKLFPDPNHCTWLFSIGPWARPACMPCLILFSCRGVMADVFSEFSGDLSNTKRSFFFSDRSDKMTLTLCL